MCVSCHLKDNLELLIYPAEITERNLDQLLDALSNSDVLLYIADKDNLDSTEKAITTLHIALHYVYSRKFT